jgi:protein-S-isoprenylcysteine O-methyltransferase Ste14
MIGLAFAGISYAIFFGTFMCFIGFVEGLILPKTIDSGAAGPLWLALLIDCGWFVLFAVQHSAMARASFKERLHRLIPPHLERSVYVLATSLLFVLLMAAWRPLPTVLWSATSSGARTILYAISFAGWGLLLVSTFLYDHFELFGLRQPWLAFTGRAAEPSRFRTPSLYRWVRHPMYLGMVIAFSVAPTMTVGHALLAGGMTAYIFLGIHFEERDLVRLFGEDYVTYRRRAGMLLPRLHSRS